MVGDLDLEYLVLSEVGQSWTYGPVIFLLVVLGIEPSALCMLGKCSVPKATF